MACLRAFSPAAVQARRTAARTAKHAKRQLVWVYLKLEILALRSEIDVDVIRERYKGETGRELIDDIKGDVSGDYCKFLCMLVNRNPSNTE